MQRNRSTPLWAAAAVVALALAAISPAHAAVTLYTDRAAFNAAAGSLTDIDFEGLAPAGSFAWYGTPSGLSLGGIQFLGPTMDGGYRLYVVDPTFEPDLYDWGSGAVLLGDLDGRVEAILPGGITAVGSDLMSIYGDAAPFSVTLSTGDTFEVPSFGHPERAFVGFTSDVPITSLSFASRDAYPELDNFSFAQSESTLRPSGSPSSTPEPNSTALVAIGTLGFLRHLRRRPISA